MSYMDFPRVNFGGTFEAGPSTTNNMPTNYNPANYNSDQLPSRAGWDPNGDAYFKLIDCKVTSALTKMAGNEDSDLKGSPVASTDKWGGSKMPAKIVDLDPEQQMVSMIYGLQLKVGDGDNYVIANMTEMWFQNYFGKDKTHQSNATYQSVLTPVEWGANLTGAIKLWQDKSPDLLSIRMIVKPGEISSKGQGPNASTPMICKILGTIGPGEPSEPINFVPARLLQPKQDPNNTKGEYNFGPAKVAMDEKLKPVRLTVDLGSSAPTEAETLTVWSEKPKGMPFKLGTLEFSQAVQDITTLINDFDLTGLTEPEADQLLNGPIVVKDSSGDTLFTEPESGIYVNACPYVFRIQADSTAEVEFWAMRFGKPADVDIVITDETESKLGSMAPPPVGRVGEDGTMVSFDKKVTTENGRATATIKGGNPDNFRKYIDGQVYALGFNNDSLDTKTFLSLLVHDRFDKEPTWDNIQPIMEQYAVLYPVMKAMGIDLGNEQSVAKHAKSILRVFDLPISDPAYMPVVRDLSDAKKAVIVAWLKTQLPVG